MTRIKIRILSTQGAILAIVAIALVGVAEPSSSAAAEVKLGRGETELALSKGLRNALRHRGISLQPLGAGALKGRRLQLPIVSGSFDPSTGAGTLTHGGGFRLAGGRSAVAVRALSFDVASKTVKARIAGKPLRLAKLAGVEFEQRGFEAELTARRLSLTGSATAALNRSLGRMALRPRSSFGSAEGSAESAEVAFGLLGIGGPETVFSKLEALGAQVGIWGATSRWSAPGENYFTFDLRPAAIAPDASAGILEGDERDGISLQFYESPAREMLFRHPRIDLSSRELSAAIGPIAGATEEPVPPVATVATLDLSAANFSFRPKVNSIELRDMRALSNQYMADQLNQRLRTPEPFVAGELLARVHAVLHTSSPPEDSQ